MVVEVTEESDEAERVGQHNHVHGVREVTVSKQVVGGVDGYREKLELEGRQVNKQVLKVKSREFDTHTLGSKQNAVFTVGGTDIAMEAVKYVRACHSKSEE